MNENTCGTLELIDDLLNETLDCRTAEERLEEQRPEFALPMTEAFLAV